MPTTSTIKYIRDPNMVPYPYTDIELQELSIYISQSYTKINNIRFHEPFWSMLGPKVVKLYELEHRLVTSRDNILSILNEAGCNLPNKADVSLTYNHIIILSKAYEKSLKEEYKKTRKSLHLIDDSELKEYAAFFSQFVKNSHQFSDLELFEQRLDYNLIEQWLYKLATTNVKECVFVEKDTFYFILRRLKFRLQKLYNDIRSQIFSIVITHNYHIFPGEEDNSEKSNTFLSFSAASFEGTRRAIINFFIKAFNHEKNKYRNTNTKYNAVQFITRG